jgi:hypothetical protein
MFFDLEKSPLYFFLKASIPAVILISISSFGQGKAKKVNHTFSVGAGRTWFDFNNRLLSGYPAIEIRLGWGISRQLYEKFILKSGLSVSSRVKRSSYFDGQYYRGPGVPLVRVDETVSKLNHFALEVPLLVEYSLIHTPIAFQLGLRGRDWQATYLKGDILKSRKEVGIITGISHKLKNRLTAELEIYSGLTKLYYGSVADPSGNIVNFSMRNRTIMASLSYRFSK